jgi:hypothetical protein
MDLKEIVVLIIFLVFILPGLLTLFASTVRTADDPSPENIENTVEEAAEKSIPWWIGVLEWFTELPNQIASILIAGFIFFLIWVGFLGG